MKNFKSHADKIRLVHCRCGSRLPWKECHAAFGSIPHYHYNESEILCWRYSPFGCDCGNNEKYKKHFKCCWQDQSTYHDDSTGRLFGRGITIVDNDNDRSLYKTLKKLVEGKGPNEKIFPSRSREEMMSFLRRMPMKVGLQCIDPDGISVIQNWDTEVNVSIVERIGEDWFEWNDLHWFIPKSELIQRTKEWNEALLKYCDDKSLTGIEREEAVRIYTASPLAPCANPTCNEIEVDVKNFAKCSRCRRVAYCSKGCQAKHWKSTHKKNCTMRLIV